MNFCGANINNTTFNVTKSNVVIKSLAANMPDQHLQVNVIPWAQRDHNYQIINQLVPYHSRE